MTGLLTIIYIKDLDLDNFHLTGLMAIKNVHVTKPNIHWPIAQIDIYSEIRH